MDNYYFYICLKKQIDLIYPQKKDLIENCTRYNKMGVKENF